MKQVICVLCPRGCRIGETEKEEGYEVEGNLCPRGRGYAIQELKEPLRTLTTTVCTAYKDFPRLPVRTEAEVPLRLFPVLMEKINPFRAEKRFLPGEEILKIGGISIIATADSREIPTGEGWQIKRVTKG